MHQIQFQLNSFQKIRFLSKFLGIKIAIKTIESDWIRTVAIINDMKGMIVVLIISILVLCPFFNYLVITYCHDSYLNAYVRSCSHQKVSSPSETKQHVGFTTYNTFMSQFASTENLSKVMITSWNFQIFTQFLELSVLLHFIKLKPSKLQFCTQVILRSVLELL